MLLYWPEAESVITIATSRPGTLNSDYRGEHGALLNMQRRTLLVPSDTVNIAHVLECIVSHSLLNRL